MRSKRFWFIGIVLAFLVCTSVSVHAATVDKTGGAVYGIPATGLNKVFLMKNTVDISVAANADVYQVLNVGSDVVVLNVFTEIITANNAATSSAVDVGDGDDPNGFDNAVNMKATAGTVTKGVGGTDAYVTADGRLYTAADTIDLTFAVTGTNTIGSVKVTALCIDLN